MAVPGPHERSQVGFCTGVQMRVWRSKRFFSAMLASYWPDDKEAASAELTPARRKTMEEYMATFEPRKADSESILLVSREATVAVL